jgi:hypothetical protein
MSTRKETTAVIVRGDPTNDLVTNPPPSVASGRRKANDGLVRMARNGGLKSAHVRFHVRRNEFVSTCKYCWRDRSPRVIEEEWPEAAGR